MGMRGRELRCRLLQNTTVIIGSVALIYSVCSPSWYQNKGLWYMPDVTNSSTSERTEFHHPLSRAVEAERVFGVIATMMAITAICIALLLICCWNPDTYIESKMNPGRILYPGKLLIVILVPTALLYFIAWSLFTNRHMEQMKNDITQFGSAYWMGMCAWFTLLVILPIIYLMEQCSHQEPDISI
ncbi:uncharacterized protein si:ch211-256a21.4 isoform X1 [Chiloscyllium plagiosum]|uniref:uncharacterized protein si:ch211-256a21.4 isoform X1 n=1 Tax=Chiloscyllium plagiosum TaxID=36176 RepID=UPI001CB82A43|nr:uncharacterized protein si:ch211-256a21.4 isoform X1 [Chiloscyllium plagiosum]